MTNEVGGGDGLTEKERLRAARIERETALSQRLDDALAFIERHGYRRCDIPACNCGSWHGGHAQERLHEIYEALGGCNGTTPVPEIERRIEREARLVALLRSCEPYIGSYALRGEPVASALASDCAARLHEQIHAEIGGSDAEQAGRQRDDRALPPPAPLPVLRRARIPRQQADCHWARGAGRAGWLAMQALQRYRHHLRGQRQAAGGAGS